MTTASGPSVFIRPRRTVADLVSELGDVPVERILIDPLPGTATEADLLHKLEVEKQICELVNGTLVEKPMGYLESVVAAALIEFLRAHVRRHKLGHVTGEAGLMRLTKDLIPVPDVAFVSFARLPQGKLPKEPIPSLAPDLAVEILSKANTAREMKRKVKEYFAAGSRQVWLIDPHTRTARVFDGPTRVTDIGRNGALSGGSVVPGFSLPMRKFFEGIEVE